MSRIEHLQNKLAGVADCAVITSGINRRYYTGMKSSAGVVLVFVDKAYLLIDFRYIEAARAKVTACEVIEQTDIYSQINRLLKKHGAKSCAVEADRLTVSELKEFEKELECDVISDNSLSDFINAERSIKSSDEIEKISAAQKIAEMGFEHMLSYIREGVTEKQIQLELDYFMLRNGAEDISFDTIALSGKNTSLPHGVPSDKTVEKGDFVLLDFGATVDGYHSDMTRTVAVGYADDKMKQVYNTVLEAQLAALRMLKAGVTGREYDATARNIIDNAGYGECFGHSLGHSLGLEIHEAPYGSPKGNKPLGEGVVITCEPGIYIQNNFGVRIEDMALITENGCLNLTKSPKELIIL